MILYVDCRSLRTRKRMAAVTVEAALVTPLLFMILFGIIEVGRGLMAVHLLNNAAEAGCRAGIVEGQSSTQIKTAVISALTAAGVSGESVTVQVNDGSTDASAAKAGDEITVIAKVPVKSITWVPVPNFLGGSLQGSYTMRRE
jgi:Flp pilus assembly protein TadG